VIDSPEIGDYHRFMSPLRRILAVAVSASLAVSLCFSQDLVEAAKKEKERRDALKEKKVVSVTNLDLTGLRKRASVARLNPEGPAPLETESGGSKGALKVTMQNPPGAAVPTGPEPESPSVSRRDEQRAEIQALYDRAKERVDLLTLKILSLRQQLTTFNSMQSKEAVQKEFAETYQKLQDAQVEAAKAKEDLDRLPGAETAAKAAAAGKK
jgi:hypothetical protein